MNLGLTCKMLTMIFKKTFNQECKEKNWKIIIKIKNNLEIRTSQLYKSKELDKQID